MARPMSTGILVAACSVALGLTGRAPGGEPLPKYTRSDGPEGVQQYVPGRWGMIAVEVANPADQPAEVLAAMYFAGRQGVQYGRRLWLPPHARRSSWFPVRTPADLPPDKSRVEIQSLLAVQTDGDKDVLSGSADGRMLHVGMLPVFHERLMTAAILDEADRETHDAIAAMRQSRDLPIMAPTFRDPMPPTLETLDALDHLVVADDSLPQDPAALVAVRRWLHGGGRMWVLLDRVQPSTVAAILGDAMRVHPVDRVGLTDVRIEGPGDERAEERQVRHFEDPVDLVRVVGADLVPTHRVNGWPASFWQPAGRGRVLFTTLGARAWVRERRAGDPKPKNSSQEARYVAVGPLASLGSELMQAREPPPLTPEAFRDAAAAQIGYQIVSRRAVGWTLGGFCLALLAAGLGLARAGRLPWLGWIGPGLALAAAGLLGLLGQAARSSVPPTVAIDQLVEVTPGVEDFRVTGWMAVYQPDVRTATLSATRGGVFVPDMIGLEGTPRRMVWTDMDQWHWENLSLPVGVRDGPLSYSAELAEPIRARATFGPEGLSGTFSPGPLEDVSDAILAAPRERSLAVHLASDGAFTAGIADVQAPGHYLGETVLSDRQRQRQQIFQRMLQGRRSPKFPYRPMLLAWASPLDMGFEFGEGVRRSGGALVCVPLELERPAPGTRVAVPPPLLPYESVPLPGQVAGTATFNNLECRWVGPLTDPSRTMLRFQCPEELLPLRVAKAVISVKLNAPSRAVDILGLDGERVVSLARSQGPLGTFQATVDRREVLGLDPQGGLRLGIGVGPIEGQTTGAITSVGWKIDDVTLELWGETLKR